MLRVYTKRFFQELIAHNEPLQRATMVRLIGEWICR